MWNYYRNRVTYSKYCYSMSCYLSVASWYFVVSFLGVAKVSSISCNSVKQLVRSARRVLAQHPQLNVSWCLTDFFSFRMAPPDTECSARLQVRHSPQETDAHPQTEAHGCHTVHSPYESCSSRRLPVPNQKSRGGNIPFSSFLWHVIISLLPSWHEVPRLQELHILCTLT